MRLVAPNIRFIEEPAGGFRGLTEHLSPRNRDINVPSVVKNLWLHEEPLLSTRPGTTQLGSSLGTTRVLGLVPFQKVDSSGAVTRKLVSGSGDTWKVYTEGGDWTALTVNDSLVSSRNIEGTMFGNQFLVLANGANKPKKYDGTDVTSINDAPANFKFVFSAYNRVMAFASEEPSVLYVSAIDDAEEWVDQAEDAGTRNISPGDGDVLTWGALWNNNIILWKSRHLYILQGPEYGYLLKDGYWKHTLVSMHGTPAGRTIAEAKDILFWLTYEGIVGWTGSGVPEVISDPIHDTMKRINWASIENACAGVLPNSQAYLLAVPTDQSLHPNTIIAFDVEHRAFTIFEAWSPLCFLTYRLGSKSYLLFGDKNGAVWRVDE